MNDSLESSNLVEATSKLCLWDESKTIKPKTNLEDWIQTTVANIKDKIPSNFWSKYKLEEPSNNDGDNMARFCKPSKCPSDSLFDLVLWSRCSRDCHKQIKHCLDIGAKQWCFERERTPEHYIEAYAFCIKTHAGYSMHQLGKKIGESYTEKSNAEKEGYCMHQAVVNSSIMFRTLTTQAPFAIVSTFLKYLANQGPESKFHGKSPLKLNWDIFANNDMDQVTHVSIVSWIKKAIIIPKMDQVLQFPQLAETKKEIERICTGNEKVSLERLQHLGEGLKEKLQVGRSGHNDLAGARLITLALLFSRRVTGDDTWTIVNHSFDERMIKVLFKSGMIGKKRLDVVLKYLAEDTDLFPNHSAMLAVVNHFPELDEGLLQETVFQSKVDQKKSSTEEKKPDMKKAERCQTRRTVKQKRDDGKAGVETAKGKKNGNPKRAAPVSTRSKRRASKTSTGQMSQKKRNTGNNNKGPERKNNLGGKENESTRQISCTKEV